MSITMGLVFDLCSQALGDWLKTSLVLTLRITFYFVSNLWGNK